MVSRKTWNMWNVCTLLRVHSVYLGMAKQILRGCLNSWHVSIAVQSWTCNCASHMEQCTTCRDRCPTFSILWFSKTSHSVGTPKVPKSWKSSCACPGSDWICVVGSNADSMLHLQGPRQPAALKLLRFAVGIKTVCCERNEEPYKWPYYRFLTRRWTGYSAIVLALCEGRTGLAVSRVFEQENSFSCCPLVLLLLRPLL